MYPSNTKSIYTNSIYFVHHHCSVGRLVRPAGSRPPRWFRLFLCSGIFFNLLFFNGLGLSERAWSSEKEAGESAGGGHEAKGESPGESKLELKSKGQINSEDYLNSVKQLQSLEGKVKLKNEAIQDLLKEKNKEKDKQKLSIIAKDLSQVYKEYTSFVEEYNRIRDTLIYRFPEHGELKDEGYQRIQKQTLEEVEKSLSVEGRIKKVMKTMRVQYKPPPPNSNSELARQKVDSKELPAGEGSSYIEKARPSLTQPIHLSK